jgi:hypothetical protein
MSENDNGPDPSWLPWLADSPMFIDGPQVGAFYDAVVRPAFRTVRLEISSERSEQLEKAFGGKLGVTLPAWFPWLRFEAAAQGSRSKTTGQQDAESITLEPVESASRQLVELSLHYLLHQPKRIWFPERPEHIFPGRDEILKSPRMIALLDIPEGTKFIPMAAELNDGRVVTFFGPLADKLQREGGKPSVRYPDDPYTESGQRHREKYWAWFSEKWNANKAVQVIEDVIGEGGRPRWIDYRVPFDTGETLHLHVAGRGEFDTGVFAYNLVKRGWTGEALTWVVRVLVLAQLGVPLDSLSRQAGQKATFQEVLTGLKAGGAPPRPSKSPGYHHGSCPVNHRTRQAAERCRNR